MAVFKYQLFNLVWGCFEHMLTNNKDNKRYLIQKYVFLLVKSLLIQKVNKTAYNNFIHLKPRTGKVLI